MSNQLIIIGNGFDLACGLKSSYEDFYDFRYKMGGEIPNKTIWDELLRTRMNNKNEWNNIETTFFNVINNNLSFYHKFRYGSKLQNSDYMLQELRKYEAEFCKYLAREAKSQDYHLNYQSLIQAIAGKVNVHAKYAEHKNINVLSFNYTNCNFPTNYIFTNVHGAINENNIIFGVDGHECFARSQSFTKTSRVLDNLARDNPLIQNKQLLSNISTIKFYGHSLSSADYSYFQSIFDNINLYSGDTRLIFLYSEIPGEELSLTQSKYKKAIMSLIKAYGDTLDNIDHGKNLLHKLMLEQRLFILEITNNFNIILKNDNANF